MRAILVAGLFALTLLSGCSGGPSTDDTGGDTTSFDDLGGEATETTGLIRGVVVDDRIVPIAGATIALTGSTSAPNKTSDDQGRFLFEGLQPGDYFLQVSSPLHHAQQAAATVVAGEDEPKTLRVQLVRLFTQDPYPVQIIREGYFQCSQAGAGLYSSSNCVVDPYRWAVGTPSPTQRIDNVTDQKREWHSDVGPGWQSMVFEMEWEPTSQGTSSQMSIVVSTQKSTRQSTHFFAWLTGGTPIRGELKVGEQHETAADVEPTMIPPEGMTDMSYFVSVARDGATPGIAYNQQFRLYLTQFYYGIPPEGWSFVNGDPMPF